MEPRPGVDQGPSGDRANPDGSRGPLRDAPDSVSISMGEHPLCKSGKHPIFSCADRVRRGMPPNRFRASPDCGAWDAAPRWPSRLAGQPTPRRREILRNERGAVAVRVWVSELRRDPRYFAGVDQGRRWRRQQSRPSPRTAVRRVTRRRREQPGPRRPRRREDHPGGRVRHPGRVIFPGCRRSTSKAPRIARRVLRPLPGASRNRAGADCAPGGVMGRALESRTASAALRPWSIRRDASRPGREPSLPNPRRSRWRPEASRRPYPRASLRGLCS